jgi:hypothetical protein
MPKPKIPPALKKLAIGSPVAVTLGDGREVHTRTRSAPWQASGQWIVLLEGMTAGYALHRVRPLEVVQALLFQPGGAP